VKRQKALELDPFSVRLNQHLGMTYYLARKFDDAITQFKQAIELDPANPRCKNRSETLTSKDECLTMQLRHG
jgi:Flp pilus assembly protein TadD